jgi:putative ABC transport system ATP-binding protein
VSIGLHGIVVRVRDGRETRTILDRVSLHIPDGAVVAVTGESGSGKSTMIAVAGLLRQPDRGRVSIDGEDATSLSSRARTRMRGDLVGLIFQSANLFPSLALPKRHVQHILAIDLVVQSVEAEGWILLRFRV